MITTLKNNDEFVIAYCEWRLVGNSGLETPAGKYIWVNDIWVHPLYRSTYRVNLIIDEVMRIVPQADYCYFQRKDVNNKLHMYSRRQWERRRHAYDSQITKEK